MGVGYQGNKLNYGNPTHRPKVMFTFGVNSVCVCARLHMCLCVDTDPLGKSLICPPEAA